MKNKLSVLLTILMITLAQSAEIQITLEIPRLETAEYHRPYIAGWIEDDNAKLNNQLFVWYRDKEDKKGEKWLKDLRRWWRKGGRELSFPIDGVSGATRPVGTHKLVFNQQSKSLQNLKEGSYTLFVEAVREVGNRELIKFPFSLPASEKQLLTKQGKSELGKIEVIITP